MASLKIRCTNGWCPSDKEEGIKIEQRDEQVDMKLLLLDNTRYKLVSDLSRTAILTFYCPQCSGFNMIDLDFDVFDILATKGEMRVSVFGAPEDGIDKTKELGKWNDGEPERLQRAILDADDLIGELEKETEEA
jgi:hypothetical protein